MKKLLQFILQEITGEKKSFTVEEINENDQNAVLEVKVSPDKIGLVIGKGGKTIKSITTILRVKAKIEDKMVNINVSELS